MELSIQICIACPGYLYVDSHNQIAPKAKKPVLFLSAAGINFGTGPSMTSERSKYFFSDSRRFIPGQQEVLKARVKQLYEVLFKACQEFGVTHPTAIGIGMGNYLGNVEKYNLMVTYHQAIFDLLENKGMPSASASAIFQFSSSGFRAGDRRLDRKVSSVVRCFKQQQQQASDTQ